MKVTSTLQQPFTPIELTITIESDQELNLIKTLLGCNLSIPEFLKEESIILVNQQEHLTHIMNFIFDQLPNK